MKDGQLKRLPFHLVGLATLQLMRLMNSFSNTTSFTERECAPSTSRPGSWDLVRTANGAEELNELGSVHFAFLNTDLSLYVSSQLATWKEKRSIIATG